MAFSYLWYSYMSVQVYLLAWPARLSTTAKHTYLYWTWYSSYDTHRPIFPPSPAISPESRTTSSFQKLMVMT